MPLDNTPNPAVNRRGSRRLALNGQARVECRKGAFGFGPNLLVAALDLSETGLKAVLKAPLGPGQEVEVLLHAPGLARPVKRQARVVWELPHGEGSWCAGLRFDSPVRYADVQRLGRPHR